MAIVINEDKAEKLRLSDLVDIAGFAQMVGVQPLTVHAYRKLVVNAERQHAEAIAKYGRTHPKVLVAARALERAQANPVPDPVAYIGNVPVWTKKQVYGWMANRPGQGTRSDVAS